MGKTWSNPFFHLRETKFKIWTPTSPREVLKISQHTFTHTGDNSGTKDTLFGLDKAVFLIAGNPPGLSQG